MVYSNPRTLRKDENQLSLESSLIVPMSFLLQDVKQCDIIRPKLNLHEFLGKERYSYTGSWITLHVYSTLCYFYASSVILYDLHKTKDTGEYWIPKFVHCLIKRRCLSIFSLLLYFTTFSFAQFLNPSFLLFKMKIFIVYFHFHLIHPFRRNCLIHDLRTKHASVHNLCHSANNGIEKQWKKYNYRTFLVYHRLACTSEW